MVGASLPSISIFVSTLSLPCKPERYFFCFRYLNTKNRRAASKSAITGIATPIAILAPVLGPLLLSRDEVLGEGIEVEACSRKADLAVVAAFAVCLTPVEAFEGDEETDTRDVVKAFDRDDEVATREVDDALDGSGDTVVNPTIEAAIV